ncbi:MAG: hypothetical protein PVJ80_17570 [Gemmatimonadota bacterium]
MFSSPRWMASIGLVIALGVTAACDSDLAGPDPADAPLVSASRSPGSFDFAPDVQQDLAALRAYASGLQNLDHAMDAGFDFLLTDCRDNPPVGGMGYHYGNLSRIEGAAPEVLEPEILVFAPKSNGGIGLAAVEYVVPYGLWEGDEPPVLFGHTFGPNDGDGVWQLHVWLWRHNPAGVFQDWNPAVSCG